jgi:1,4-alpha-glucan branching enzyme
MDIDYQWEKFIQNNKPEKDLSKWESDYGPKVIDRKNWKVQFNVYVDNPKVEIYIVGNFNNWGKTNLEKYKLKADQNFQFYNIILTEIKHKDPYKFLVKYTNKQYILHDPASYFFDDLGNSIFWDYDDKTAYKQKYNFIDTIKRSTKIIQTDLPGLIVHWQNKQGKKGSEIKENEYYNFISDSGILDHIKDLGFNTIQFLPFAQSIDGNNWKYRYLVPYQYSIQKNWGNPDDFARMIDECHKKNIAVIGDFIVSHFPYKDFKIFNFDSSENGLHLWKNKFGYEVYMKERTPWGTMRPDFDNKHVRDFLVSSCIHFMKRYKIDGFRIDNVDGIIRFGDHGQGDERPNGRTFLRELNSTVYSFNPYALIHLESHYFYKDNAKLLVIPIDEDPRAIGGTCYNSSRITYYFHVDYMIKGADAITPWKFKHISEEKEWGKSNSTIADFHNHDAAAGLMELRATGSYAYDAMTCKQPHNHFHALGKIKVMEAIIAFCTEGRTLDLMQTFLLQKGTFEHDSSIQWFLAYTQCVNNLVEYKKKINLIMDDEAFWPLNVKNRNFLNIDEKNKILVIERKSDKSDYVIIINLSSWVHHNYKVGLTKKNNYEVILNADLFEYSGTGLASLPKILKNNESKSFELLDREIELPMVGPYQVLVLKRVDKN